MLRDITLGQYYPVDSLIHRLDPRTKLFGTMVFILSLFVANNIWGYLLGTIALAAVIVLTKVPVRFILKGLKAIVILLLISVSFNLFLTPGRELVRFWIFKITWEGIRLAGFMAVRLIYLVVGSSLMTLTTTPNQLTDGLEKALMPLSKIGVPVHAIAMMMSIALRFIPILIEETDKIMNAQKARGAQLDTGKVMLNVALPKGRLGDKVYNLLAGIGYGCPEDYNATRKLVVENPEAGIRYFLVKPSDVAIYVEHGAADVGIVGKDILTEASADVYELLDTGLGKCRMCVAAPADYKDDPSRPVRVATKFVNIAKSYYASMGRDIDIIKLNGSIELAPILGLSDVIVDIVETGTTLRENGLKVVTEFMPISARFIANKASYQFKHAEMDTMLEKLRAELQNKEEAK